MLTWAKNGVELIQVHAFNVLHSTSCIQHRGGLNVDVELNAHIWGITRAFNLHSTSTWDSTQLIIVELNYMNQLWVHSTAVRLNAQVECRALIQPQRINLCTQLILELNASGG